MSISHVTRWIERLRALGARIRLPKLLRGPRRSEGDLFRRLIETSNDAIILFRLTADRPWPIVHCNTLAAEMHGYTPSELVGLTLADIDVDGGKMESMRGGLEQLRRQGRQDGETRHRRRDGSVFAVEYRSSLILIDGVEHMLGVDRDVTARKAAEAALRSREEEFRLMVELCPDSVMLVRVRGWMIIRCNRRTCEMHGYGQPEELVGQPIQVLTVPPAAAGARPTFIERLRSERSFRGETRHRQKNGTIIPIEFCVGLIGINGEEHYLAIDRDITERKRADEELMQARKLTALGELVGGIAHEFNNLLTPMLIQASLIADSRAHDPALVEALRPIGDAARQAREMTQRILTFGRRSGGEREPLDLVAVVRDNVAFFGNTLDPRISLVWNEPTGDWRVCQNRSELNQIILNLLINARDALLETVLTRDLSAWQPRILVSLARLAEGDAKTAGRRRVQLAVSDNGQGVAAEIRDRIFEPFFTTKGVGVGTGLGLATVWHLTNQMGGTVELVSEEGAGASFRIQLPEIETGVETAHPPQRGEPAMETAPVIRPSRVLLVEDSEPIALLVGRILRMRGHEVVLARDGDEGERLLFAPQGGFGLLVTDINLPGRSGIELVARLRAEQRPVPVIMMGGYLTASVREKIETLRVEGVLHKPFEVADLQAVLTRSGGF